MAQGPNGAGCFRRELKNDRHAICKGGRNELLGEHGKMSVDFASEAPRCQRISAITPQISFDPDAMADAIDGLFFDGALGGRIYSRCHWHDPSAPPEQASASKSP
jgi:hypothetical protein